MNRDPGGSSTRDDPIPPTVEWLGDAVRLLDQRRLPEEIVFVEARTVEEVCEAIRALVVRGAPALGVTGAMGIALAMTNGDDPHEAATEIIATRPTAVNLRWGVARALRTDDPAKEALAIAEEDIARNKALAMAGASLLPDSPRVLTHCNTGSLACAGYGTALGVIRAAHEQGRAPKVWVTETRPVMQGSRLTAWELDRLGIDATVITDSAAASIMKAGEVDCVVVGADRIASNGDVANKVGTYSLAVSAAHHGIPFYVAAPTSTIDTDCPTGSAIEIERRADDEIVFVGTRRVVPPGVEVYNPAFDVTPHELVSALITEKGIHRSPTTGRVRRRTAWAAPTPSKLGRR